MACGKARDEDGPRREKRKELRTWPRREIGCWCLRGNTSGARPTIVSPEFVPHGPEVQFGSLNHGLHRPQHRMRGAVSAAVERPLLEAAAEGVWSS
jgi:hypothetical protein